MPCYHPIRAFQQPDGSISIGKETADSLPLHLPCGGCLGCRTAKAKAWALRCHLELQDHRDTTFNTLTYDEQHKPLTLVRRHLQLFIKRLRSATATPIRFFGCGEYGETTARPHYHAILYGTSERDRDLIQRCWPYGHTRTERITPARIAYAAGYTAEKIGDRYHAAHERVDPDTGEVFTYQPPFIQMSRRPGIGGAARAHVSSWRLFAVHNGTRQPVPRFLHEAWKKQATKQQIEELLYEKSQIAMKNADKLKTELKTAELIAIKKQELKALKRQSYA